MSRRLVLLLWFALSGLTAEVVVCAQTPSPESHPAVGPAALPSLAVTGEGTGGGTGALPARADVPAGWRLIQAFDFEEKSRGNYEDLPQNWYVMGRPPDTLEPNFMLQPLHVALVNQGGFPAYAVARIEDQAKVSGKESFYLGVNGGSAGAFLEIGAIPAVPDSDYHVMVWVKTKELRYARARLVAYLVDDHGQKIEGSPVVVQAPQREGEWQALGARILGDYPHAAWIGLQLEVAQPQKPAHSALGGHEVLYQDVRGGAWFDDVAVWQVPRIMVGTQSPVNVIHKPDVPRLEVLVRDLTGQAVEARLRVYDHAGQLVDQTQRPLGESRSGKWWWQPRLKRLGWYLVELSLHHDKATGLRPPARGLASGGGAASGGGGGRNIENEHVESSGEAFWDNVTVEIAAQDEDSVLEKVYGSVLWLGTDKEDWHDERVRYVLDAQGRAMQEIQLLPELLDALQMHAAVISCWQPDTTLENLEASLAALDQILSKLDKQDSEVTLSLAPVPTLLAEAVKVDAGGPMWLFSRPQDLWAGYVAPVLISQGQRVKRWQLGAPNQASGFYSSDLPSLLAHVDKSLRELVPGPKVVLPWQLSQSRRKDVGLDVGYAMDVPTSILPQHIGENLSDWVGKDGVDDLVLYLRTRRAGQMSHPRRIDDLVRRMLYVWQTEPKNMALRAPWTVGADRRTQLMPDPLAGVFATVGKILAGRRYVDRLPLSEGAVGMIFYGPRGGLVAAWNESADPARAVLDAYLGDKVEMVDVWGNRQPVPMVNGQHQLVLTSTPVFIEGVNPELAAFRAAFRVEPAMIWSTREPHPRAIQIFNPWPRTISGKFLILEPTNWDIQPRRMSFSIPSGKTVAIPVSMSFPISELGGTKMLQARFEFVADRPYDVNLTAPMEVGLPYLEWDALLTLEETPDGKVDAVVTQVVKNKGDKPLDLFAFATMPEFTRQEQTISQLMPNQSTIRVFRFSDVGKLVGQERIRVGIREANGPALLNKMLPLY
ncbi:MAG: hypothetical protein IT443_01015 [Phycisphaeraceae bacterium]|nr:hypothetical protein [Phycisphaeraceae bacterium]